MIEGNGGVNLNKKWFLGFFMNHNLIQTLNKHVEIEFPLSVSIVFGIHTRYRSHQKTKQSRKQTIQTKNFL